MSVVISNLTLHKQNEPSAYELCINEDRIVLFLHNPSDGLATCLRQAADAIDQQSARKEREANGNV